MTLADSYIVRPLLAADVPRVFKDWLMSYRQEKALRTVSNPVFFHWHHTVIESLMLDPTVVWWVAVDQARPNLIAGFICAQEFAGNKQFLVHYVYVGRSFRRLGLASRLLATLGVPRDQGVMCTHESFAGHALLLSRGNVGVYNPYLFMGRAAAVDLLPVSTEPGRADIVKAIGKSSKELRKGFNINEEAVDRTGKKEE